MGVGLQVAGWAEWEVSGRLDFIYRETTKDPGGGGGGH